MAKQFSKQFCICSCYFSHNVFLRRYKLHCTFEDERKFKEQYREILRQRGCITEQDYKGVLAEISAEVTRRQENSKQHLLRTQVIEQSYQKLHPNVYTLSESFLHPEFIDVVKYCKSSNATQDSLMEMINEEVPNVFSLPVFSMEFCNLLLEELDHFEKSDMPKGRPNTMNNYGILLSEMGFDEHLVDRLREDYLMPIASLLYPEWVGEGLDSHRAFIVDYTQGGDLDLACHYDNAEVTINICLGKSFTGGSLCFGPMRGEQGCMSEQLYEHKVGHGLLHRARHTHQAQPITSGERHNLIVWMRSSSVRNRECPMCGRLPSLVDSPGYGDGFTRTVCKEDCAEQKPCYVL